MEPLILNLTSVPGSPETYVLRLEPPKAPVGSVAVTVHDPSGAVAMAGATTLERLQDLVAENVFVVECGGVTLRYEDDPRHVPRRDPNP